MRGVAGRFRGVVAIVLSALTGDPRALDIGVAVQEIDAAAGNAAANSPGSSPRSGGAIDSDTEYSFYDKLPSYEVVVPEKERGRRVDAAARVEQPGTYFLQVGSYRSDRIAIVPAR